MQDADKLLHLRCASKYYAWMLWHVRTQEGQAKWYIIALPNCAVLGFELLDFHDVRQNMEALNIPVRT